MHAQIANERVQHALSQDRNSARWELLVQRAIGSVRYPGRRWRSARLEFQWESIQLHESGSCRLPDNLRTRGRIRARSVAS